MTPDELQKHFTVIQADLIYKIETATNEVKSYTALFTDYYVNQTRDSLAGDLETASASYWNKLLALEVEAAEQSKYNWSSHYELKQILIIDIDIISCAKYSVEQFNLLLNSTLEESNKKLNEIIHYETSKENIALALFESIVQSLSELEVRIIQCLTETCSSELNSELIQLYESASSDIDDAIVSLLEYVTVEAPTLLENCTVDSDEYQKQVEPLIAAVEVCFE